MCVQTTAARLLIIEPYLSHYRVMESFEEIAARE